MNATTNLAFLIAAWLIWQRHSRPATLLAIQIALIGLGSLAFHVFANRITGLLDVAFIAMYMLGFPVLLARVTWKLSWKLTAPWALLVPVVMLITESFYSPWRADSPWMPPGMYVAAWISLMILVWAGNYRSHPCARWLAVAVVVFGVSLALRQLDTPLCAQFDGTAPGALGGTHGFWHVLNAFVLWSSARAILARHPRPINSGIC